MMEAITNALMLLMQPCYALTQNWWLAIALFTVLVKIILLPLSLWCQKNSIVMVQLMPALNRIKVKHFGDAEAIGEAQTKLHKQMHYHPLLSLVPLAVQILILFGLVDVVHYITDNGFPGTEFLGAQPTIDGGLSWIMPLLAGASAVIMGFVSPVGFIMPNMGMFWLAEGDRLAAAPICAGAALAALWTVVGCLSLERKELG